MPDVKRTPADTYDELFVPALFQQWPPVVLDAAHVSPGDHVLDGVRYRRAGACRGR